MLAAIGRHSPQQLWWPLSFIDGASGTRDLAVVSGSLVLATDLICGPLERARSPSRHPPLIFSHMPPPKRKIRRCLTELNCNWLLMPMRAARCVNSNSNCFHEVGAMWLPPPFPIWIASRRWRAPADSIEIGKGTSQSRILEEKNKTKAFYIFYDWKYFYQYFYLKQVKFVIST